MICRKKVICSAFTAFLLFLLFRKKEYRLKLDSVIKKSKPVEVWEYVADFSNMVKLNPTIIGFHVHEERGDFRSWIYTVTYTEKLHQLPSIENSARAEFIIKPLADNLYSIESTHKTCFFSYFCLYSWSTFTFQPHSDIQHATQCIENVTYQCPAILSNFCLKEVTFQRQSIAKNLQFEFSTKLN